MEFYITYKVEENVIHIKKHQERVSFPYLVHPKQSKKELNKIKWKDIGLAIDKDRKLWYDNTMNYIKSLSGVVQTHNLELDDSKFSIFEDT